MKLHMLNLFFNFLNLPSQFPIPLIPLQTPISGRAEGVIRRALGVTLPVTPDPRIPNGRNAGTDSFLHGFAAVSVGTPSQGDHGVHAGVIFNGQTPWRFSR